MYSMLVLRNLLVTFFLPNCFLIIDAITYSDTNDYDAYGTPLASTDYFVVLAQNDASHYLVSMAPFGTQYLCSYNYSTPTDFLINVAVSRRQNSSQLSFVYLKTNSTDGNYQKLGLFTFSREQSGGSSTNSCNQNLNMKEGEHEVKVWNRTSSELSTLQVDLDGKYAYGFLSQAIFIYDIGKNSVQDLSWNNVLPSITFGPHALDVGETSDGISMAIIAGYYQVDIGKTLPNVYLIRLNPPHTMTVVDNYTLSSDQQKFIQGRYAFTYDFDYVMSVSIHDSTQQVLVGIPQLSQAYLFRFNSTNLIFINTSDYAARSTTWLDGNGTQAGLLLSDTTTLPWAQSRIQVVNITSGDTLYVYPNNQQTLAPWSNTPPAFIRLTKTYDYQLVILTTDGTVVLVPLAEAGYYMATADINGGQNYPEVCPRGTYKSIRGTTPCTICPTMTKSSSASNVSSNSSNGMDAEYPTISCIACLTDSFCPLGSISDVNNSYMQSISQAYPYPPSPSSTSFDDILMQNTFSLQTSPRRCLIISPFFWALIALLLAFIILLIMGILYSSPTGQKHFHRLECVFRHSDLIGNGELWFGGLISLSIIVLIIYSFWFGTVFVTKYPIETSSDADFACDPSLRNAQFSSSLQLLSILKSDEETAMFNMLDQQNFTMTVNFVQTGYTCNVVSAQENVDTYSVALPPGNCTAYSDNATISIAYEVPDHEMTIQINLAGPYYIGGIFICLTGPRSTSNDSLYTLQKMDYCELFYTPNQTLGQTTEINFALTKVINKTGSLDYSNSNNYSGVWIPTATHGTLNDRLAYEQRGAFLRYLSTQQILIITFSETQFYVSNEQEPIAQVGEILFHSILFTTTVIGIFALAFLIFKLTFMPIVKSMVKREMILLKFCKLRHKRIRKNNSSL